MQPKITTKTRAVDASPSAARGGVALIDLSFQAIAMDEGASAIFSAVDDRATRPLGDGELEPKVLPTLLEQIRRASLDGGASTEIRFTAGKFHYVARARFMQPSATTLQAPCIMVQFEREAEPEDALGELSVKCNLTDREQEALRGIAIGLTSKEVAQRMNISPSTVKTFLRLIMIKTGAQNRAEIVAKLVAPSNRSDPPEETLKSRAAG